MRKSFFIVFILLFSLSVSLDVFAETGDSVGSSLDDDYSWVDQLTLYTSNYDTINERTNYIYLGNKEHPTCNFSAYQIITDNSDYDEILTIGNCGTLFFADHPGEAVYFTSVSVPDDPDSKTEVKELSPIFISSQFHDISNYYNFDYWCDYLDQFLGVDKDGNKETYDDYREQMQNKDLYFCLYNASNGPRKNAVLQDVTYYQKELSIFPLTPEGESKGGISSLRSSVFYPTLDHLIPFFYVPAGEERPPLLPLPEQDEDEDTINKFVVYMETVAYLDLDIKKLGLSSGMTYKNNFTWDVEKYPYLSDCTIEVRACPYLEWTKTDFDINRIDWYYFCSPDVSKAKSTQKDMPVVNFTDGLAVGYRSTLEKYYYNWFQRMMNSVANTYGSHFVWQVRAVYPDGSAASDWCTFVQDPLGGKVDGTGDVYINDNGERTGSISDDVNYDPANESSGVLFDDSAGTSNTDPNVDYSDDNVNMNQFVSWLKNISDSIGEFPSFLAKVYAWLPNELIIAITSTIGFLILLRILGR